MRYVWNTRALQLPVSRRPPPPCQRLVCWLIIRAASVAHHPEDDLILVPYSGRQLLSQLALLNRVAKIPPRVRPSKDAVERVDEQMTSGAIHLSLIRGQCRGAEPILCKPSTRKLQCQNRKFVSRKRLV